MKNNFNELIAKIKEENIIEFADVSAEEISVNKIVVNPFKL